MDWKGKQFGLVFEGGGAKGAYEIGAWKALERLNIAIDTVVGTSVGALNGALFAQNDLDTAMDIWKNIRYSSIIQLEDRIMEQLMGQSDSQLSLIHWIQESWRIILSGGLDISPLKQLLEQLVDEDRIRQSPIRFGLTTFNLSDMKPKEVMIEDIEQGRLVGYLLASSYLPAFRSEKIYGKRYLDGAFHNVAPISMLVQQGYKDIIVVRIKGMGIEQRVDRSQLNIIEIRPREALGGILQFEPDKINYNMKLGYYDTLRTFGQVEGIRYYLQVDTDRDYFREAFVKVDHLVWRRLLRAMGKEYLFKAYRQWDRLIYEGILPLIAKVLKCSKKDGYRHLYLKLLEKGAWYLRVERFSIYSLDEFKTAMRQYDEQSDKKMTDPLYPLMMALAKS